MCNCNTQNKVKTFSEVLKVQQRPSADLLSNTATGSHVSNPVVRHIIYTTHLLSGLAGSNMRGKNVL